MKVEYSDAKLEKKCTRAKEMTKSFDHVVCKSLQKRLAELKSAITVENVLEGPGVWHWLHGSDVGCLAGRLSGNWRIIVRPDSASGACEVVVVEGIEDYH